MLSSDALTRAAPSCSSTTIAVGMLKINARLSKEGKFLAAAYRSFDEINESFPSLLVKFRFWPR